MLSLAELWRKGQPYARARPGASTFASYAEKQALRRLGPPPQGIRLAGIQLKEAFFGDIDDKYLPTFHSLRLVLRAGLVSSAPTCWSIRPDRDRQNYAGTLLYRHIGGRHRLLGALGAVDRSADPTCRSSRCGSACSPSPFRRCLELFQQRVHLPVAVA